MKEGVVLLWLKPGHHLLMVRQGWGKLPKAKSDTSQQEMGQRDPHWILRLLGLADQLLTQIEPPLEFRCQVIRSSEIILHWEKL